MMFDCCSVDLDSQVKVQRADLSHLYWTIVGLSPTVPFGLSGVEVVLRDKVTCFCPLTYFCLFGLCLGGEVVCLLLSCLPGKALRGVWHLLLTHHGREGAVNEINGVWQVQNKSSNKIFFLKGREKNDTRNGKLVCVCVCVCACV